MKQNRIKGLPDTYEVKVLASLDTSWSKWFEGWDVTSMSDGTTALTGRVVDQAELHGLLMKIRNLNLPLVSVNLGAPYGEGKRPMPQESGPDLAEGVTNQEQANPVKDARRPAMKSQYLQGKDGR